MFLSVKYTKEVMDEKTLKNFIVKSNYDVWYINIEKYDRYGKYGVILAEDAIVIVFLIKMVYIWHLKCT